MIKLRKALTAYLKSIHPQVFYQMAPDDAQYPYVVFDFPTTFDDGESQQVVTVDIDGWDISEDTTALETLMAAVNGNGDILNPTGLNKRTLTAENMAAVFYLDTNLSLTDDDKRIRRRKYIYQAKMFG